MATELYLDTARLGRMHPSAFAAARDFDRLCGSEGGSPLVERFIGAGSADWPASHRRRYPGLAGWGGLDALKSSLRALAGVPDDADVHLAGRSGVLMRLVARAMFRRCRRILHTDVEWPAHVAVLDSERRRAGRAAVTLPVRDQIFREGMNSDDLAALVADGYRTHGCDGLFLTAVSHDGIRFPLGDLAKAMALLPSPRFVAIDAAQALGHTPAADFPCDALLAGGHKWLRSGRPLAMAFAPRGGSRGLIRAIAGEMESDGELDDPLLGMSRQLGEGVPRPYGATAEPSGLLCTAAAIAGGPPGLDGLLPTLNENASALAEAAASTGWRPVAPTPALRSGILLLQAAREQIRDKHPDRLRSRFQRGGLALTAYDGGIIRLSMPPHPWRDGDLNHVRTLLQGIQ